MPPRRGGPPQQYGRGVLEGEGGGDGYGGRGRGGRGRGYQQQDEAPYYNPQFEGGRGGARGGGGRYQQGERGRGGYRGGGDFQQDRREGGGGGGGYGGYQQGGYSERGGRGGDRAGYSDRGGRGGDRGGYSDRGGRGGNRGGYGGGCGGDRGGPSERGGRGRGDDYSGRRGRSFGAGYGAEHLSSAMASLNVNEEPITFQGPDPNFPKTNPVPSTMPTGKKSTLIPPSRCSFGTVGKQVLVRANHFLVQLIDDSFLCQYDVDITPRVTSKGIARSVIRHLIESNPQDFGSRFPVYDGSKSLYIAGRPLFERKDFQVCPSSDGVGGSRAGKDPMSEAGSGRQKVYMVSIRNVALLNRQILDRFLEGKEITVPQEFLQALDITMRESPVQRLVPSGRSFYDKSYGARPIDGGLVAWNGFYQSLRPTMQGLVLNIDLSTTAFNANIPVLEYIAKKFGFRISQNMRLSDADRHQVKKALARLKVQVTHRKTARKYRIAGLSDRPTGELQFTSSEGQEIKVVDYFMSAHGYRIEFPGLPCLMAQGNKVNYLPMEVCMICEGQKYGGRLTQKQTRDIQSLACQKPHARESTILDIMRAADGPGRGPHCADFGIQISTQFTGIRARLLPAPSLRYRGHGKMIECMPKNGQWNFRDQQVVEGANIQFWSLICFDERMRQGKGAEKVVDMLSQRCGQMGINLSSTAVVPPEYYGRRVLEQPGELEGVLKGLNERALQQIRRRGGRNLQLLVCIFEDKHVAYGDLKRICETEIGLVTQCCLSRHVLEFNSQYLANLGLKINVKMGGRNVMLSNSLAQFCPRIFSKATMFIGIDVSHPPSGDDTAPSIAAVVGSTDWPTASRYIARVCAQGHRTEILDCVYFKRMIKELWTAYRTSTNLLPERIIVFRDGVSEGQFDSVLQNEVVALKEALGEVGQGKYAPPVTWAVVQKRHHTRLFPADDNRSSSGNIPAGTVVDSTITHPREFDFYLCSHYGIQGTSRPTHYHVLWDENAFYPDEFQGLIYNLCHTYARATKSVSIVPPAYYAHLAAFRARLYLDSAGSGSDTTSFRGGEAAATASAQSVGTASLSTSRPAMPNVRPIPRINPILEGAMYFC